MGDEDRFGLHIFLPLQKPEISMAEEDCYGKGKNGAVVLQFRLCRGVACHTHARKHDLLIPRQSLSARPNTEKVGYCAIRPFLLCRHSHCLTMCFNNAVHV